MPWAPVTPPRQTRSRVSPSMAGPGPSASRRGRFAFGRSLRRRFGGYLCWRLGGGLGLFGGDPLGLLALDRLLARLALVRVAARRARHDAGGIEKPVDPVRRQRAMADPVADPLLVERHPVRGIARQQRIVGAELFDEAPVTRRAHVGDHDPV